MDDTIIDNQKGEVRRLADAPSAQNVTRLLAFCGPQTHGVVRSEALHALWTTTRDALREPESERAKEILGAFESDAARACIIERLDDALESVRASAARLAGDLRIEGARDALVHLAKDDPSDSVRRHAAHAIAQLEQR